MTVDLITRIGFSLLQLLLAIVLMGVSLYIGYHLFVRATRIVEGEKELLRGNKAVGIVIASFLIGIALVVQSGISGVSAGVGKALSLNLFTPPSLLLIGISLLQLVVGIVLAVVTIFLALRIFNHLTGEVDEFEELKKGNVAVALELAGIIIAIALILQAGVAGITGTLL